MAQNKRAEARRRRPIHIECPICTDEETTSSTYPLTYTLPDVGEETTFDYQGTPINISVQSLIETKRLGFGSFGFVRLVEVKDHPDIKMAVKRISLASSQNNANDYTANIDLRTMHAVGSGLNPHLIRFYASIIDRVEYELLICMEPCETSMDKFYTTMHAIEKTQHLDLLLKRMINHIADALLFLKSQNILHRDVKPSNILLNQNPIIFKLCDFGTCGQWYCYVASSSVQRSLNYLEPERMRPNSSTHGYSIRSDMWALGLSIVEIATNKHPFSTMSILQLMNEIKTWIPELPPNISAELQELVFWLLKIQPEDRPERYENILTSPAIQSLPTEITKEEEEMVKIIIEHIPQANDD